jgi:hypothetical protein
MAARKENHCSHDLETAFYSAKLLKDLVRDQDLSDPARNFFATNILRGKMRCPANELCVLASE